MTKNRARNHARATEAMQLSRRCGAKTRSGPACRSPAVASKARCRMHGGAARSGAQMGNQNAFKHGMYTREMLERNREISELMRDARRTLNDLS